MTNYSSVHNQLQKVKVIILLKEMLIAKQKHYINLYMNNNIQLIKKKFDNITISPREGKKR